MPPEGDVRGPAGEAVFVGWIMPAECVSREKQPGGDRESQRHRAAGGGLGFDGPMTLFFSGEARFLNHDGSSKPLQAGRLIVSERFSANT